VQKINSDLSFAITSKEQLKIHTRAYTKRQNYTGLRNVGKNLEFSPSHKAHWSPFLGSQPKCQAPDYTATQRIRGYAAMRAHKTL